MLLVLVLLLGIGQTLYGVTELVGRDGHFTPTTWVVAGLCFALAELIRRQNQQTPEVDKQVVANRKHPLA